MQGFFAFGALALIAFVFLIRAVMLKNGGFRLPRLGGSGGKELLPAAFFLAFCLLLAARVFGWSANLPRPFLTVEPLAWAGAALCAGAAILCLLSVAAMGSSFRIGIDETNPGGLVQKGAFARSRNPISVAFLAFAVGCFFIYPDVVFLFFAVLSFPVLHRQILREEESLRARFGEEYEAYAARVSRYL